tara:strand:+ start:199 stop:435 length:237 start_codon:yes stop_codon:yes gene_type:complete
MNTHNDKKIVKSSNFLIVQMTTQYKKIKMKERISLQVRVFLCLKNGLEKINNRINNNSMVRDGKNVFVSRNVQGITFT